MASNTGTDVGPCKALMSATLLTRLSEVSPGTWPTQPCVPALVPKQRLEEDPVGLTESLASDLSSHQSLGISSATGLCFTFLGSLKGKRCICFKQKNPFSSVCSCTFFTQLFNHLSKHPLSTCHVASPGNTKMCKLSPCDGGGAHGAEDTELSQ